MVAVVFLAYDCNRFPFQLGPLSENPNLRFDFHVSGNRSAHTYVVSTHLILLIYCFRGSLKVQLRFAREFLAVIADEQLRGGQVIPVVPLLFTQGVNEKQSLTNKHG